MKTLNSIKGYLLGLIATAALFGFNYTLLITLFFKENSNYTFNSDYVNYVSTFFHFNDNFFSPYSNNFYYILIMSICLTIIMVFLWIKLYKKSSI